MEDNKNIEVIETAKVKKKLWKTIVKGLLIFSAIILVSATVVLGYCSFKYGDKIKATIKDGNIIAQTINKAAFNTRKPTQIYDGDVKLLKEFITNPYYYTKGKDLNPYVGDAITSIEDERFYEHHGIDYKGIRRSIWVYVTSGGATLQGGSTITQQLARNVFLTFDVTLWRKLEEAVIAQKLEQRYSKAEILEFYVNNVNYGNGCYSIESASQYYFQKSNTALDLSQIAMLAAIPNNPSLYNPVAHLGNAIKRRNLVLDKMLSLGKISQNDFNIAKAEVIKVNIRPNVKAEPMDSSVQYAVDNATIKLMEQDGFVSKYNFVDDTERNAYFKKYNAEYATKEKQLLAGGYRIDTSIDSAKQEKLQIVVDSQLQKYTDTAKGLYKKQGASVTIDNSTGEVVAIVGGRSQYGNTYNRAFLAKRQPGSAIKPLIAYTPAFEKGYIPESEYVDKSIEKDKNGKPGFPVNDDFIYRGDVALRYAVEISINTIPVRLVGEMGVKNSLQYLRNMQFKYITPEDTEPIVGVGGFNKGVTPVEMASGYSALSRNGMFISPTNVRKITNTVLGKVLFENKHEQTKVYDSGASYLMTDTLKGVLTNKHSTGRGLSLSNYPFAAGKTGTTDHSVDCWFVGYTPYYTTSVWVGDDINKAQNMSGASGPGPIWKEYMEYLHQGLEQKDFTRPNTIITKNGVLMDTLYIKLNTNGKIAKTQKEILNEKNAKDKLNAENAKAKLSDDQEKASEKLASDAVGALEGFALTDKSQYAQIDQLIQSVNTALQNVKSKDIYLQLQARLQAKISNINNEKSKIENPPVTVAPPATPPATTPSTNGSATTDTPAQPTTP